MTSIMWSRQHLRLGDNPALSAAATCGPVLPVYILDEQPPAWPANGEGIALVLAKSLGGLLRAEGDPQQILPELVSRRSAFDAYPWRDHPAGLAAWRDGHDAQSHAHDRRELSVKHRQIDWRQRQRQSWFWHTLVVAGLANNAAGYAAVRRVGPA